jgi:hypothetical protein
MNKDNTQGMGCRGKCGEYWQCNQITKSHNSHKNGHRSMIEAGFNNFENKTDFVLG